MDGFVEHLVEVGHVDRQLADVAERRRNAQRKVDSAEAAVRGLEAHLAEVEAAIATRRKEERALQGELERVEGLARSARQARDNGLGSPEAAERQIARCADLADAAETSILESMEKREALEADRTRTLAALEEARAQREATHAAQDPELASCVEEKASWDAERATVLARMPRELKGTYARLMEARGVAVATMLGDTCSECRHVVPLRQGSEIRAGRLVTCSGCGCWLVAEKLAAQAP